jgi:hypothetical protein
MSKPVKAMARVSRCTIPSVKITTAASSATIAGNTSPPPLVAAAAMARQTRRAASAFFSCGRNVFIHFAGVVLLDFEVVRATPGTNLLERAAEEVWIEVVMGDRQQRAFWEDAAKQAKATLASGVVSSELLLESHGLPARQVDYQTWAVGAVHGLLARHAAGAWPKKDESWFANRVDEAAARAFTGSGAGDAAPKMTPLEREMVSAINLRDLQEQHFVGVEPSVRDGSDASSLHSREVEVRPPTPVQNVVYEAYPFPVSSAFEVVSAADTTRLYLSLSMTPPRGNRGSIDSIASSLARSDSSDAEIITGERVMTVQAKMVEVKGGQEARSGRGEEGKETESRKSRFERERRGVWEAERREESERMG